MTDAQDLDRLSSLIDEERQALIDGDFERIADLLEEKEALVTGLQGADPRVLEPVQSGLRRNQELFDQALAGLRNVANKLGHASRLRKSMTTYDASGQRQSIDAPRINRLEKRA